MFAESPTQPSSESAESVYADVLRFKAAFEAIPKARKEDLLYALDGLRALGSLPTKVLVDSKIGITLNQAAKDSENLWMSLCVQLLGNLWTGGSRLIASAKGKKKFMPCIC